MIDHPDTAFDMSRVATLLSFCFKLGMSVQICGAGDATPVAHILTAPFMRVPGIVIGTTNLLFSFESIFVATTMSLNDIFTGLM
jgi:hypothetical protein